MSNRNNYRDVVKATSKLRLATFDRRGIVEDMNMLDRFNNPAPTEQELREELEHFQVVYKTGDRLYKFAHKYYGNPTYWWIIAWYNNKPTDTHFSIGDTVYIPKDLQVALRIATREN